MPIKISEQSRIEERIAECMRLFIEFKYSEKELQRISDVLSFGIQDRDWKKLQTKYQLPDQARAAIDNVIHSYWDLRANISVSKALPETIDTVVSQCKDLKDSLAHLRNNRDFFKGVHAYYDESPAQQSIFMENLLADLQRLELLLANAQQRIKAPAHRPTHFQIYMALRDLDNFLTTMNLKLTDDRKSIAYEVMWLADPKLTSRIVGPLLKEFVRFRTNWAWTGLWVEHDYRR
jgi:hypothetical protein